MPLTHNTAPGVFKFKERPPPSGPYLDAWPSKNEGEDTFGCGLEMCSISVSSDEVRLFFSRTLEFDGHISFKILII